MRVIGITNQHEVTLASREAPFKSNEILIVEDQLHGPVRVEVVETRSQNPLLGGTEGAGGAFDDSVLAALRFGGFDPGRETLHVATVRVLQELSMPITVGSPVRKPFFEEVKDLLIPEAPERCLLLGIMRGTETVYETLPDKYRGVAPIIFPQTKELGESGCVPFYYDVETMSQYPHIGVIGGTGSGKSVALRVIQEEILRAGFPAIALDYHAEMAFSMPCPGMDEENCAFLQERTRTFTVGVDVGIRFEDLTINDLIGLLRASMDDWTENMEQVARRMYQPRDSLATFSQRLSDLAFITSRKNWDGDVELDDRDKVRYRRLEESIRGFSFGEASVSAVMRRFRLLEGQGLFRNDSKGIEDAMKEGKMAIIRGSVKPLNLFAVYILRRLYGLRRRYRDSQTIQGSEPVAYFPPFFVISDEAHNLAPKSVENDYAPARPIIKEIAQEGRKYGTFLVLATQRVALLDDTVNAMLNTKIVLRTVRSQDIDTILRETDLGHKEASRLPYLSSGNAYISLAAVGRTIAIRIRAPWTKSPHADSPFDEWRRKQSESSDLIWAILKDRLPLDESFLALVLMDFEKSLGRKIPLDELEGILKQLAREGRIISKETPFGNRYELAG